LWDIICVVHLSTFPWM